MSDRYYDNYLDRQIASGINKRIFSLYQRIRKTGLQNDMKILEIGCGIGALTFLLARKVNSGTIEAVDFSNKSVDYAAKHITRPNVTFTCSDILRYSPKSSPFDRVIMFDVLEHIPQENHPELFGKISEWMHPESQLLINIPNPFYLLYDQKNNPSQLQEVDQPLFLHQLADVFQKCSLQVYYLETYSIWVENDYQFFVIKKEGVFDEKPLDKNKNGFQKLADRIRLKVRKLWFNYPVRS
jgi:cyclopropane fatty-acyl-phospholipid synthase-like methyltransferase